MNQTPGASPARLIDNTDWLKAAAILFVFIDHVGDYLLEDGTWWRLFGRLAAPAFFFLIGYAHASRIPRSWIVMGVILTGVDWWHQGGGWVPLNILLNFCLLRLAQPLARRYRIGETWPRLLLVIAVVVVLVPDADLVLEYGGEGWLWALVGFLQRDLVDRASSGSPVAARRAVMRLVTCGIAGLVYIVWEQREFSFDRIQLAILVILVTILCAVFCRFRRGPSPVQLTGTGAALLQFVGRRTLELYFLNVLASVALGHAIRD